MSYRAENPPVLPIIAAWKQLQQKNSEMKAFQEVLSQAGPVLLVGSFVRDTLLGRLDKPRDLDVMVDVQTPKQIEKHIKPWLVDTNVFGGFIAHVGGTPVDVWPFSQTWPFRVGLLPASRENYVRSVVLSTDAVLADLSEEHLYTCGFWKTFQYNTMDLIFKHTGMPSHVAFRALAAAKKYRLHLSPELRAYIREIDTPMEEFLTEQKQHYGKLVVSASAYLEVLHAR